MPDPYRQRQAGNGSVWMLILLVFIGLIVAGTWAAYTHGEGHIYIDGRTVSELEPWEVVGGVIIGIFGAIIGLAGGALGLIIGLAATVVAFALGLMGVAAGLFITAGVVLGPFLLIAAIILLMRRGQGGASGATARFDDYTDGL